MSRKFFKLRGQPRRNVPGRWGVSRRTLLRGAGAAIALPFLDVMRPLSALAAPGDGPPTRLLFYYVPNGIHMPDWTPTQVGTGYDLPPILASVAPLQSKVSVISGLDNAPAKPDGPGDHASGTGAFITCAHPYKTEGADIKNGISADQLAANELGGDTTFPSLQVGLESGSSVGNCDSGYSCAYATNISWADEVTPLPKTVNPQLLFDRLFGGTDPAVTAEVAARRKLLRKSILDYVHDDALALQAKLGKTDAQKVEQYLDGVRELEKRLENESELICEVGERPEGPYTLQERIDLMNDLMVLAMQCDQSRFLSFMFANAGSGRSHDFLGVPGSHHEISHHQNDPGNHAMLSTICTWEIEQFMALLTKMDGVVESDGQTLLDHSLVFFSSEIEDGNSHSHYNMPILLAGRAGGSVNSGRHIESDGPVANLLLSMVHAAGGTAESLGDSTGVMDLS